MGRVFSPLEVAEQRVPSRRDFARATRAFDRNVRRAIGQGIVSGLVYGSLPAGTGNERSDLDGILVHDGSHAGRMACREIVVRAAKAADGLVPINVTPYSRARLAGGRTEIDRFFGYHLTQNQRLVWGVDPASYIRYREIPGPTILTNFLDRKQRKLERALVSKDEAVILRGIQTMLELPVAVGRKVLQVVGEKQGQQLCPTDSADKGAVAGAALAFFSKLNADTFPLNALYEDQRYSAMLIDTLEERSSQSEYIALLNELGGMMPDAIDWVDTIDERLPRCLDGTLTA